MSLGGGFSKAGRGRFMGAIGQVFNYAHRKGMLIVVSAGNSAADLQHNGNFNSDYCDAPHVICVSAVGPETFTGNPDLPAFYTNYGRSVVTVAGPGGNAAFDEKGNIKVSGGWPWSGAPGGADIASWVWAFCPRQTVTWSATGVPAFTVCSSGGRLNGYIGTSQASPHVAGLAALLVEKLGHGQPDVIKDAIIASSDPINPLLGRGRISVNNALGL
jgi:subtilisin family serine protease